MSGRHYDVKKQGSKWFVFYTEGVRAYDVAGYPSRGQAQAAALRFNQREQDGRCNTSRAGMSAAKSEGSAVDAAEGETNG